MTNEEILEWLLLHGNNWVDWLTRNDFSDTWFETMEENGYLEKPPNPAIREKYHYRLTAFALAQLKEKQNAQGKNER